MDTLSAAFETRLQERVAELLAQPRKNRCEWTAAGLAWLEREYGQEEK